MSRTDKDKKYKVRYGEDAFITNEPDRKKRKKSYNPIFAWATPSWWTRIVMNRPQRRDEHLWEKKVLIAEDLEEVDAPDCGKWPLKYYY